MAELRISCPHCKQDITCDDQWAGQELQCPLCQGAFVMPGSAPAKGGKENALVPKPPAGGSKLSVGQAQVPAQAGRQIPIRNLSGPAKKKESPVMKILVGTVVLAALGVGGYFGFGYIKGIQDKNKAKSQAEARNSDGGQVGHIANLNNVLDATEPAGAGLGSVSSSPERTRRTRPTAPSPTASGATDPAAAAASTGAPPEQVVPPKYTLDVELASIPESKVNGTISGTNFVAETSRVDTVGTAQVLRLLQGQPLSPDREVLIYLPLKAGEKLGGQSLVVSNMMRGAGVPQVAKRWKTSPQYAPTMKTFSLGYAMKLELGQTNADNTLPGRIYLALPDREQTVIAGSFKATIYQPDPNAQPVQYTQPVATPQQQPSSASDAMQRRYGIRR